MKHSLFCVIGGTGFVGQHLLNCLSEAGYRTRVPTRHPARHRHLRLVPGCEVVEVAQWDAATLREQLVGCQAVVNLAGLLNEGGGRGFEQTHVGLVEQVSEAALAAGVPVYVQMSALNADPAGPSAYLQSKGRGEAAAWAAAQRGLSVTVLRPSVIFGAGDHFYHRFATLLRLLPGPLPLACAEARFAPVHVADVASAIRLVLETPSHQGQVYQLCGPRVVSLREVVSDVGRWINKPARIIALNDRLAQLQARIFEKLPGQLFTQDHYRSLQVDSVCTADGFGQLGIRPTDVEVVMPMLLKPSLPTGEIPLSAFEQPSGENRSV
ncbi:epimerase [Thiocapsa imhoffii]|uniref:Epimerase n=1 Tax=Thiocapsa imhoffii TaxID=382777 RepID=A0A9X0WJ48_9GAMM|nr:complex I NDUFA9 subunit family protein [Thiocapsa imhoffii]MBK1645659.1 epimerase [Thiocapsa imhoffii]